MINHYMAFFGTLVGFGFLLGLISGTLLETLLTTTYNITLGGNEHGL